MNHPETDISLREYKKVHDYLRFLTFKENDVRLEYFQLMSSIYDRFHKGFAVMDFLREIVNKRLLEEMILNNESYKYIFVDYYDKDHYIRYFGDSSRRFIIDSWSVFELTITQLLDFLLDDTSKEKFLNKEFNQLKYITVIRLNSQVGNFYSVLPINRAFMF